MKKLIFGTVVLFILLILVIKIPAKTFIPLDSFKEEFLFRINSVRQKGCMCGKKYMPPADPLTWNTLLETSAYWHARDMSLKKYFSHTSKDGKKVMDRTVASGYGYTGFKTYNIGENIAQGQRSIKEVVNAWFKSTEHCKNLMNPAFKEVGVAIVGNYYWVQDFGGREPFKTGKQAYSK